MAKSYSGEFSGERYETPSGEEHHLWVDREVLTCSVCGDEYEVRKTSSRKTCSVECGHKLQAEKVSGARKREDRSCANCGEVFTVTPSSERVNCSDECSSEYFSDLYTGRDIDWADKISKGRAEYLRENEATSWELNEELGHVVKSTWEEDFAYMLYERGIEYEYEGIVVEVGNRRYLPDFVLRDAVVEVKGWTRDRDKKKAEACMNQTDKTYLVIGSELPADEHFSWENREEVFSVL
jgi:hypothetical protein